MRLRVRLMSGSHIFSLGSIAQPVAFVATGKEWTCLALSDVASVPCGECECTVSSDVLVDGHEAVHLR